MSSSSPNHVPLFPRSVWAAAIVLGFLLPGSADAFEDLTQPPAAVEVVLSSKTVPLSSTQPGQWSGDGVVVNLHPSPTPSACDVSLGAPGVPVAKLHLHWDVTFDATALFLGDTWERAYGDLQWKPIATAGVMPWYFLVSQGSITDGYGVMTGPSAFCYWKVDSHGINLWADVRSGSVGVELGTRTLTVCTLIARKGPDGETAFAAAGALCRAMCPHPRIPAQPVYGFNDWYCAYGKDTAAAFLADAAYTASLCPTGKNKPYMVIDDGWQLNRQGGKEPGNPWTGTNANFGSTMPEVARAIKAMNARAGLWYRPLQAWSGSPANWHLVGRKGALDPSNPEVLQNVSENMKRFKAWGFELVKHDFSSNEITGKWGPAMGEDVVPPGVIFSDRSRTTAEIMLKLYRTIRDAAGNEVLVDGCNTFSHLSAGIFEMDRIGDDTSGKDWARTLKYGVNCLAFRGCQHDAFYLADPDCAGLAEANAVPWEKNSQWLDLAAHSGMPLFVSWPRALIGPEQEKALRAALLAAAEPQPLAEPLDWLESKTPSRWNLGGRPARFRW